MKSHRAYTIIELLLTVAIVALLASLAIPMYQDYSIRTRVAEGLNSAAPAKLAVSETYNSKNAVPNQVSTGYVSPAATINVSSITIANDGSGQVIITYPPVAGDGTIILTPTLATGQPVNWDCTGGTLLFKYRPKSCRI